LQPFFIGVKMGLWFLEGGFWKVGDWLDADQARRRVLPEIVE